MAIISWENGTDRAAAGVKIVLVDTFLFNSSEEDGSFSGVPHLGLTSLAAVLAGDGHAPSIFSPGGLFVKSRWREPDEAFVAACVERILERDPDITGFTTIGLAFPFVVRLARRLKAEHPRLPIVLGGPQATLLAEEILTAFDFVDVIAGHECELTVTPLMEGLVAGHDVSRIAGVTIRRRGRICHCADPVPMPDLDTLPEPAHHLYPTEDLRTTVLGVEAGRGCPFDCTFCSTASYFRRRYRLKSVDRLVEDMTRLNRRFGTDRFSLYHDLFTLNRKHVLEFCRRIEPFGYSWNCSSRADSLDEEMLGAMARAGCSDIFFGLESGSQRMQASIRKRLCLAKTTKTLRRVVEAGMACTTSFITGFPEETLADQDATLDLLGKHTIRGGGAVNPQLHMLSPEPGSALMAANGDHLAFDGMGPEPMGPCDEELVRTHPRIFSAFHHFPTGISRWRAVAAVAAVREWTRRLRPLLFIHIVAKAGGGSLASLFNHILPLEPPPDTDWDATRKTMMDGLLTFLDRLPEDRQYIRDIVRCALTLGDLPPLGDPGGKAATGPWKLRPGVALRRYDHDAFRLYDAVLQRPENLPRKLLRQPHPTTYLLYRRAGDERHGVPLSPGLADDVEAALFTPGGGHGPRSAVDPVLRKLAEMGLIQSLIR